MHNAYERHYYERIRNKRKVLEVPLVGMLPSRKSAVARMVIGVPEYVMGSTLSQIPEFSVFLCLYFSHAYNILYNYSYIYWATMPKGSN